jgi:hypothetical protein
MNPSRAAIFDAIAERQHDVANGAISMAHHPRSRHWLAFRYLHNGSFKARGVRIVIGGMVGTNHRYECVRLVFAKEIELKVHAGTT